MAGGTWGLWTATILGVPYKELFLAVAGDMDFMSLTTVLPIVADDIPSYVQEGVFETSRIHITLSWTTWGMVTKHLSSEIKVHIGIIASKSGSSSEGSSTTSQGSGNSSRGLSVAGSIFVWFK